MALNNIPIEHRQRQQTILLSDWLVPATQCQKIMVSLEGKQNSVKEQRSRQEK